MKISICSMCCDGDFPDNKCFTQYAKYLNLNLKLTEQYKLDYEWIVSLGSNNNYCVRNFEEKNRIFPKIQLDKKFLTFEFEAPNVKKIDEVGENSVEHGLNLNECLKRVSDDSDFVLLLDSDFYILPPLNAIMHMMKSKGLSFFGAPYAQSTTPLIRDFPVGFCLFINRETIDINTLDFCPGYGNYPNKKYYPDVGYKIYSEYKNGNLKYDYAIPVIDPSSKVGKISLQHEKYEYMTANITDMYGIEYSNPINEKGTWSDEYFYNNSFFGLHTRCKLNKRINQHQQRIDSQIKSAERIITKLRKQIYI